MNEFKHKFFWTLLFVSLIFMNSEAQQALLKKGVFGLGGGKITSANYTLNGTLGQSFIGNSTSALMNGKSGFWFQNAGPTTAVSKFTDDIVPNGDSFFTAYPNPFSSEINFRVNLKESQRVSLRIYDGTGKLLQILVDDDLQRDQYNFIFNSGSLPDGLYYSRLVTENSSITKKISIIR